MYLSELTAALCVNCKLVMWDDKFKRAVEVLVVDDKYASPQSTAHHEGCSSETRDMTMLQSACTAI